MNTAVALGAPGIYPVADEFRRTLGAERMDVCAFVGVAPRGPARVPVEPEDCDLYRPYVEIDRPRQRSLAVAIDSWDQYLTLFGSYEGPGRLPYAVANFFEQGGSRAYVVRIVHDYGDATVDQDAVARMTLDNVASNTGSAELVAKTEGTWGNGLRAAIGFTTTPVEILPDESTITRLVLPERQDIVGGTLLRIGGDTFGNDELRFVSQVWREGAADSAVSHWHLNFDGGPLPGFADSAAIVKGDCLIIDASAGIEERFREVGLSAGHPRWLANVLYRESALVNPTEGWIDAQIIPLELHYAPGLRDLITTDAARFSGGMDRYADIVPEDFFDPEWVAGNALPGSGVHALTHLQDLSILVTPDLYVPEPLAEPVDVNDDEPLSGADFAPCAPAIAQALNVQAAAPSLPGLMLNPSLPGDLAHITALQSRLVTLAETLREFVVMLDVPPGLHRRQILAWRTAFRTPYAAAYHPWVNISSLDDTRDALILLNPAAVAAGIVARQEHLFGVPHGPANALARAVVSVEERVSPASHDQLHPLGINVFLQQRDGIWLTAARTLSRDRSLRQLSVQRLMVMLRRVLLRQMQWVVFEPNCPSLWSDLRSKLTAFLRQLYVAGAFKGATEIQAYFVRCDGQLNDRRVLDAGKLIAEIGVAPTEPLEFIVVRITRDGDGTLTIEG